ncbi:MAG: hypothetical protein AAF413_03650 [Patescibacteria group bacterium]
MNVYTPYTAPKPPKNSRLIYLGGTPASTEFDWREEFISRLETPLGREYCLGTPYSDVHERDAETEITANTRFVDLSTAAGVCVFWFTEKVPDDIGFSSELSDLEIACLLVGRASSTKKRCERLIIGAEGGAVTPIMQHLFLTMGIPVYENLIDVSIGANQVLAH